MRKTVIIFSVLVLITSGCGQTTRKQVEITDNEIVVEQTENNPLIEKETTEKLTEYEAISYLETFRELLLNNQIEELTDLIHFPIEGDYVWEQTNKDGEVVYNFNSYRTEKDFVENYSKLFGEDLTSLLKKVDFKKALKEYDNIMIRKEPNIELTFYVSIDDDEQELEFMVGYDETDCDICESAIIYRSRKIDGKIKLTTILFAG